MNKKKIINAGKYLLFFAIGVAVFWLVYRDMEMDALIRKLKDIKLGWVVASVMVGFVAHMGRAYRWNMLIKPTGYQPSFINSFFSVLIMYMTNLAIPRGGEVARCGVMSRYEKPPFSKLIGTVVIERITDVMALFVFAVVVFFLQFNVFEEFIARHPQFREKIISLFTAANIFIAIGAIAILILLYIIIKKRMGKSGIGVKIKGFINDIFSGIQTIRQLDKTWLYIVLTVFINVMYLLMIYLVFFSFEPTMQLTFLAAWATFVMSAFGMMAPVQAGIGPWHFMVMATLVIYGIQPADGKIFALVAHSSSNLSLLIGGVISLILLPVVNRKKISGSHK
jgi:hypothetical protein